MELFYSDVVLWFKTPCLNSFLHCVPVVTLLWEQESCVFASSDFYLPPCFLPSSSTFQIYFLICFQLSSTFPSHSSSSTFFFFKCTLLLTVIVYLLAQLTNMPSAIGAANIDWFLISGKPNFLAEGEAGWKPVWKEICYNICGDFGHH